jgi:hypothetical protein
MGRDTVVLHSEITLELLLSFDGCLKISEVSTVVLGIDDDVRVHECQHH